MTISRRGVGILLTATVLVGSALAGSVASPAAAATTVLPPLDPARLAAAVAGLPDAEASGALVQIRGRAGNWSGSSGISELGSTTPPRLDGRFRIGSMTKTFTAVVTLQLAAERRIDLDRPVQRYLPGLLPASYPPIPVRTLLNWTSGINGLAIDSKNADWFFDHRYDHYEPGSQLDLTKPLAFAPGTAQRYANADYILAGLLIEKVTGRSWASEVNRRIIRPLHLTGTTVPGDDPRISGPHAHGYEVTADGWADVTEANPSLQWSAASIISTADDLDRFLVALFRGRLLPPRELAEMFTVPDVKIFGTEEPAVYSAGLTRFEFGTVTVWAKSGDRPGYNNGMGATRDLSRRLVYSVNTLHMGGSEQPRVSQRIIMAALS
ncbi:serine hydrolase domain-containing protein [Actinoplanes sp. NPDC051861]|uniref:serine hydrolase domain-containing protein n=1 Tax=Actinoplanes sp. NPDC051861 TaxID=3155170 RepID=UPI0034375AC3